MPEKKDIIFTIQLCCLNCVCALGYPILLLVTLTEELIRFLKNRKNKNE